jgi:hypothetical protein
MFKRHFLLLISRQNTAVLVYNPGMIDSQQVTVELPLPLYRFLERLAAQTRQPLETLVAQSVVGNLPPSVDNAPLEAQADLLALQLLPIDQLQQAALEQVPPAQQKRHLHLLAKDDLTSDEQAELAELRRQADRLMLRKAYAWAVLRWRGHPIPRLDEIPLE